MRGRDLKGRGIAAKEPLQNVQTFKKWQVPQSEREGICLCDLEKRSSPQFPSREQNLSCRRIIQIKGSGYFSESYDGLYFFRHTQTSQPGYEQAYP